ncbi:ribonuclease III [Microthyrium microscopicum]|uniref:Large ribosomal subunit protein mL44 n=1 Tax=Microthyrium microscopicum TaxID=703497 RepID=A0A6A6U598_9PEZI|nr:ribonuclease III [Microthyrium microscopicum]
MIQHQVPLSSILDSYLAPGANVFIFTSMKRIRIRGQLSTSQFTPFSPIRNPIASCSRCKSTRHNSSQAAASIPSPFPSPAIKPLVLDAQFSSNLERFPSPPPFRALQSAKLAALHARLDLSPKIPLQTLARALVDATADPDRGHNNASLAILGGDVLGYYCSEHLMCHYPRLPLEVLWAAQRAFIGPDALGTIAREWGVDAVRAPGGEVDPGLLQFRQEMINELHYEPGYFKKKRAEELEASLPPRMRKENPNDDYTPGNWQLRFNEAGRPQRTTITYRVMNGDQFGMQPSKADHVPKHTTLQEASSNFVRALFAIIHLHGGQDVSKQFFRNHFSSRALDLSKLFAFDHPNRDLLLLCLRENFEPPVARLISETGRRSAHPVFIVGVFSGHDKLGEGVGASLLEAKTRAAVAALKGWYLYSPLDVTLPSEARKTDSKKTFKPNMVDPGEVVVY